MRTKRIFAILSLIGLLAVLTTTVYATTSRAQSATPSLVGTWKMTIPQTPNGPVRTEALQCFFADGNFI